MSIQLTFDKKPITPFNEVEIGEIIVQYYNINTPVPSNSKTWRAECLKAGYTLTSYGKVPAKTWLEPHEEGYVEVRARKVAT